MAALSERENAVVERHLAEAGLVDGARVHQWDNAVSVYYHDSGRLWVHRDNPRKQAYQELVFHARHSVANTLTCSHPLKFWDLRRHATPRETARVQGFPDSFRLPKARVHRLFANAVGVPCARHAVSCVVDEEDPTLRFVDLCAGIGGFHVAATQAHPRAECVGFSEIFLASVRCYRDNFPDAPALGDATRVTEWPACDLLCAGFPCQPFSNCNNRVMRADHAHKDFFHVVLDAIRATGATRVVLENVPTLLTNGRERWDELRDALQDELGFRLDAHVLNAHDFGLPQTRRRLYIVGRRDGVPPRPLAEHARRPGATLGDICEHQSPG